MQSGTLGGRPVTSVSVVLKPGDTKTITVDMTSGPGQVESPIFSTTPGIKPTPNDFSIASACSG